MSAWSGRPESTIQLVSEVAARAPISDSDAGSWSATPREVDPRRSASRHRRQGAPSRPLAERCLLGKGRGLVRRPNESAASSWETAASSSRRSRSSDAGESRAACSNAHAAVPNSPSATLLRANSSSSLASASSRPGDAAIRCTRRACPTTHSAATGVEHLAASRAEVGVDGSPVERMSKGQLRGDNELAHDARRDGFIDGIGCVCQFGDGRDHRRGGVLSQGRGRCQEGLREVRERCDPGEDHCGQLSGCGQSPSSPFKVTTPISSSNALQ